MTGKWNRPLSALGEDIKRAAGALADAKVDIVVFHCTGHAMEEGPDGDARTRELIKSATGIEAISTASAIQEALGVLKLKRLILLTPYDQDTNDHEIDYLRQIGLTVVHDVALALPGSDDYLAQPPGARGSSLRRACARRRRRIFPELHQHHPDRGDRADRAETRQAGRQQQPGRHYGPA